MMKKLFNFLAGLVLAATPALAQTLPLRGPITNQVPRLPTGITALPSSDANIDDTCNPGGTTRCLQLKYLSGLSSAAQYVVADPNGLFLYIWDNAVPVKKLVATTNMLPAFAVEGDLEVGDIHCIFSNPCNYFYRVNSGLPVSATTNLHSAIHDIADTDGGASIQMVPTTGGTDSDGYIALSAFGKGSGPNSNVISFASRSAPNTSSETARIDLTGIHSAAGYFMNGILLASPTPPTIASGGCTTGSAQSISGNNGSAGFQITLGGATCGSTIVLTMPTAIHGWSCAVHNVTSPATNFVDETATTTTSLTFTNFVRTTGVAGNFTGADGLVANCTPF